MINRSRAVPARPNQAAQMMGMGGMMGAVTKPAASSVAVEDAQVVAKMRKDKANHKPVMKSSTIFHSKTQIGEHGYVLIENEGDEDVTVALEFKLSLFAAPGEDDTDFELAAGE